MGVRRAAALLRCGHPFFFFTSQRLNRTMNRHLFAAAALALTACSSFAHADESTEIATLKGECAAKYEGTAKDLKVADANEHVFVYAKGEYKGEAQPGKVLPCTEKQFVAYLDTVDPVRVMSAYPTAAGRPTAAKAADKK
jgi:hypothetical protein